MPIAEIHYTPYIRKEGINQRNGLKYGMIDYAIRNLRAKELIPWIDAVKVAEEIYYNCNDVNELKRRLGEL